MLFNLPITKTSNEIDDKKQRFEVQTPFETEKMTENSHSSDYSKAKFDDNDEKIIVCRSVNFGIVVVFFKFNKAYIICLHKLK